MIHRRGTEAAYESIGENPRRRCVFEDDGSTGYLYVLDYTDGSAQPIKDAVQIYQGAVANDVEHSMEFRWSADGSRFGLYLDGALEAFVDFDAQTASGRSNFPAVSIWTQKARPPLVEHL